MKKAWRLKSSPTAIQCRLGSIIPREAALGRKALVCSVQWHLSENSCLNSVQVRSVISRKHTHLSTRRVPVPRLQQTNKPNPFVRGRDSILLLAEFIDDWLSSDFESRSEDYHIDLVSVWPEHKPAADIHIKTTGFSMIWLRVYKLGGR